jgi:hypothetical protein
VSRAARDATGSAVEAAWRRINRGTVVALVVAAALLAGAATYVVSVLWPRWPGATATDLPSLPITIAGVLFNVPPAALRVAVQRHAGNQERIDLAFLWPSLEPPGPVVRRPPSEEPQPFDRLFVTVAPSEGTLDAAARFKDIYPRYLGDGPYKGPDGLAVSLFRDGTPYQGEDLFFATTNPEDFIVRCTRPVGGPTPGTCLLERRLGAADVTFRFPRDWLADWRGLAAGIERLISRLRGAQVERLPEETAERAGVMSRGRHPEWPSGNCTSARSPRRRRRARR